MQRQKKERRIKQRATLVRHCKIQRSCRGLWVLCACVRLARMYRDTVPNSMGACAGDNDVASFCLIVLLAAADASPCHSSANLHTHAEMWTHTHARTRTRRQIRIYAKQRLENRERNREEGRRRPRGRDLSSPLVISFHASLHFFIHPLSFFDCPLQNGHALALSIYMYVRVRVCVQ